MMPSAGCMVAVCLYRSWIVAYHPRMAQASAALGYKAVARIYNALMTGLVLTLVSRRGAGDARRFVFAHFRRQHLEKFLPGLKKLGLAGLPDAVACAQYHY